MGDDDGAPPPSKRRGDIVAANSDFRPPPRIADAAAALASLLRQQLSAASHPELEARVIVPHDLVGRVRAALATLQGVETKTEFFRDVVFVAPDGRRLRVRQRSTDAPAETVEKVELGAVHLTSRGETPLRIARAAMEALRLELPGVALTFCPDGDGDQGTVAVARGGGPDAALLRASYMAVGRDGGGRLATTFPMPFRVVLADERPTAAVSGLAATERCVHQLRTTYPLDGAFAFELSEKRSGRSVHDAETAKVAQFSLELEMDVRSYLAKNDNDYLKASSQLLLIMTELIEYAFYVGAPCTALAVDTTPPPPHVASAASGGPPPRQQRWGQQGGR